MSEPRRRFEYRRHGIGRRNLKYALSGFPDAKKHKTETIGLVFFF